MGHNGIGLKDEVANRMGHPAEIQILQGRGERWRTQVTDGASAMVELGMVMPRIGLAVVRVVVRVVVRGMAAIVQEGPRQCQEAHRNDEQTCEI